MENESKIGNESKMGIGVAVVVLVAIVGVYLYLKKDVAVVPDTDTTTSTYETTTTPVTTTGTSTMEMATTTASTSTTTTQIKNMTHAIITTNKGIIEVELATDKPLAVGNFQKLASEKFYDGVRFHRVIKGFMIQAGDPLSKDVSKKSVWGTGGPGYTFKDELTGKETYTQGTLAMANAGPNTNGSQFFIVTASPSVGLQPDYTVFGKVTKGLDIALAIENVKTDATDKPVEDVVITSIVLK